jgi:heptosyltransferase-3
MPDMTDKPAASPADPSRAKGRIKYAARRRMLGRILDRRLAAIDTGLCLPGALPARGIYRILVIRPNHRLGNTVLVTPLLKELETLYPGAAIDIVSAGHAGDLLLSSRFQMHRVFSFHHRIARHLPSSIKLLREMRKSTYDLAIDACSGSNSGRLLLGLSNARYKLAFAHDENTPGPLSAYEDNCPEHMALRSVHLLRMAYARAIEKPWPMLDLDLSPEEERDGARALKSIVDTIEGHADDGPVVGVFANATGAKCYPESWWAAFVSKLQKQRPQIRIVDVLAEHGNSQLPGDMAPYFSRHLRRMASVLGAMDAFISADCGVMHLAVAAGVPTLGLFSQDNMQKYAPYGGVNDAMQTRKDTLDMEAFEAAMAWIDQALEHTGKQRRIR